MIFVGIDFGHGETTISRIPGVSGELISQIAISNSSSDKKVTSAVCKKDGKWALLTSNDDYRTADLREGFKAPIHKMSPRDRESMKEFAKLIFDTILGSGLHYNKETNQKDFILGIACPSGWEEKYPNSQQEYLDFFREECELPVDLCIKESEAAFFSKYGLAEYSSSDTVFVIDLGSSTIDFTTFSESKCHKDFCWGRELGAHKIDDALLNIISNAHRENIKEVNLLREKYGHKDCSACLSLFVREAKERFYATAPVDSVTYHRTEPTGSFQMAIRYEHMGPWDGNPWDNCIQFSTSNEEYNHIISNYKISIKEEFILAKNRLTNAGITPNRILLSGGASWMPFIQDYTRQVFGIEPDLDPRPECVVSNGIAMYAQALYTAWERVREYLEAIDYAEQYKGVDIQTSLEMAKQFLPPFLDQFKGPDNLKCVDMKAKIVYFFIEMHGKKEFVDLLKERTSRYIKSKVTTYIHDAIYKEFKISVDTSDINLDVNVFAVGRKFSYLHDKIRWIMTDATKPHIFTSFDESRYRELYDRLKIVQYCKERLCTRDTFSSVEYNDSALREIADTIKEQCIAEAKRIFFTKQLFDTTFKQ